MGDRNDVVRALGSALDPGRVIADASRLAEYRGIAWGEAVSKAPLPVALGPAAAAVRPQTVDDVVAVVGVAKELGVPIVPYGAGTGVHGGAAPLDGSIVLDMGAMDRIISVSRDDRLARVQAGVVLGDLDRVVSQQGLLVGHDPWSQPIATVGGATSTNGVGYLAGKYGSMGDQVVGIEAVLASGQVLRTRPVPKSSTGPSLRHLFIGGEGLFGIITELDLRVFPIPERRALAGYRFGRFEDGMEAVMEFQAVQLRPSMIDYEEDEPSPGALVVGQLVDLPSLMFLAFEGFSEEVAAHETRADWICRRCRGEPLPPAAAQEFWDTRHASAEQYLRRKALDPQGLTRVQRRWSSTYINVGLPASAIQEYRVRAARELAPLRLAVKASGVWGIPELFSVKFEHQQPDDENAPQELDAGCELGLRIAQELGGSMEYCHGVGVRLAHLMVAEWAEGFDALRALKRAWDPSGLLNPGKLGL